MALVEGELLPDRIEDSDVESIRSLQWGGYDTAIEYVKGYNHNRYQQELIAGFIEITNKTVERYFHNRDEVIAARNRLIPEAVAQVADEEGFTLSAADYPTLARYAAVDDYKLSSSIGAAFATAMARRMRFLVEDRVMDLMIADPDVDFRDNDKNFLSALTTMALEQASIGLEGSTNNNTKLLNDPKAIQRRFTQERKMFLEYGRNPEAVMVVVDMDISKFKRLNTKYGRSAVDRHILPRLGEVLNSSFRISDIVCNRGGDEFQFVFSGVEPDAVSGLLEKVRSVIADTEFMIPDRDGNSETVQLDCRLGARVLSREDLTTGKYKDLHMEADAQQFYSRLTGDAETASDVAGLTGEPIVVFESEFSGRRDLVIRRLMDDAGRGMTSVIAEIERIDPAAAARLEEAVTRLVGDALEEISGDFPPIEE